MPTPDASRRLTGCLDSPGDADGANRPAAVRPVPPGVRAMRGRVLLAGSSLRAAATWPRATRTQPADRRRRPAIDAAPARETIMETQDAAARRARRGHHARRRADTALIHLTAPMTARLEHAQPRERARSDVYEELAKVTVDYVHAARRRRLVPADQERRHVTAIPGQRSGSTEHDVDVAMRRRCAFRSRSLLAACGDVAGVRSADRVGVSAGLDADLRRTSASRSWRATARGVTRASSWVTTARAPDVPRLRHAVRD